MQQKYPVMMVHGCVRAPFVDASISEQIRKIVWWLPTAVLQIHTVNSCLWAGNMHYRAHTPISVHHYSLPVQIQHVFAVSALVVEFHWGASLPAAVKEIITFILTPLNGRHDCMMLGTSCCFSSVLLMLSFVFKPMKNWEVLEWRGNALWFWLWFWVFGYFGF